MKNWSAEELLAEWHRMCKKHEHTGRSCGTCYLGGENYNNFHHSLRLRGIYCFEEYIKNNKTKDLIEKIQAWSKEHLRPTYKDIFIKRNPGAQIFNERKYKTSDGILLGTKFDKNICVADVFDTVDKTKCNNMCFDCWEQPADPKYWE